MTLCLLLSCVTLLAAQCGLSQGQLESVDMEMVTENLGRRFEEIRTDGLRIDALQDEYNRIGFTFSRLENPDIDALLSNTSAAQTINTILTLFDNIASGSVSPPASPVSPANCCDTSAQSTLQSCCHGCETVPSDAQLFSTIEAAYRTSNLPGVELEFGFSSGSILRFPTFELENECTQRIPDARLEPWYIDSIRVKPREVVLLVDATRQRVDINAFPSLRSAAIQILESLTYRDKVGVIVFDTTIRLPPAVTSQVIPVCQSNKDALVEFLESSVVGSSSLANYSRAFSDAISLFTNDTNSDKLLIFFANSPAPRDILSNGLSSEQTGDTILSNVSLRNMETGNAIVISVYRDLEFDPPVFSQFFTMLVEQPMPGTVTNLNDDGSSVTGYYSPFLNDSAVSLAPILSHQINSNGANSLSISHAFYNGSSLLGVFHAVVPWQRLFGHITPTLERRQSSYILVVGGGRRILYHPLLPGNLQSDVLVTDFEADTQIINSVLDMAMNQPLSTHRAQFKKIVLVPTSGQDFNGFLQREVPSTYHCRDVGTSRVQLYVCMVLADEDVATVVQRDVDVAQVYASRSSRPPVYHNVTASVPLADQCDYFCRISVPGQLSFQLTGASVPTTQDTQAIVQQITAYIEGRGTRPPFVQPGVDSEAATSSVVAESWLNQTSQPSVYISRRHLATPSGLYLTYPALQLVREFQPSRTEWYAAIAARTHTSTSTLTLTTPHNDPLQEGGRFVVSVGSALRAPTDQSDTDLSDGGQLLTVVAADIQFASLRIFVRDALPLCEQNGVSCFIMDDLGRLVYHADFFGTDFTGESVFFSRGFVNGQFQQHWAILVELQENGTISKQQCVDHFNSTVRQRLFLSLSLQPGTTYQNNDLRSCTHYMIRHIPGTNTYFAVVRPIRDCGQDFICFCSSTARICINCDTLNPAACECPCDCPADCVQPRDIPPCPQSISEDANVRPLGTIDIPRLVNCGETMDCIPQCVNQNCSCKTDFDSCFGARDCNWCEAERKCVHYTECCTVGDTCCQQMQTNECQFAVCFRDSGVPDVCPTEPVESTSNTAVIAGVIGGLVGVLLLSLLLVFILWYQFCRNRDLEDDSSRGSAFDFSSKRVQIVNPSRDRDETPADEIKNPETTL